MNDTKQTVKLLSVVFDVLNSMDDRECLLLIQGKGNLRFVPIGDEAQSHTVTNETAPKSEPVPRRLLPASGKDSAGEAKLQREVDETALKLNEADARAAAKSRIASINVPKGKGRKDFLIRLAKACAVHVESKDTIAGIEQKLVEDTVGAKLRSKAFREVAF